MMIVPNFDFDSRRKEEAIRVSHFAQVGGRFRGEAKGRQAREGDAMAVRKLVAGNWKMHGTSADLAEIGAIAAASRDVADVDVALCLPATLIARAALAAPGFALGGQDV